MTHIYSTARFTLVLLGSAAGFAFAPQVAAAQQDVIAQCAAAATPEAQIKCLEDALRGDTPPPVEPKPAVPAPEPAPALPATPAPQVSVPIVEETPIAPAPVERALVAEAAAAPAAVAAPTPAPVADELGAEQVEARRATAVSDRQNEERTRERFAVASVEDVYPNKLRVFLENGQVWQQIQGDAQRINLRGDDLGEVEIWKSRLGGYKLRILDRRRTVRVRRLR